ncbi:MAG: hypothetical protein ACI84E_001414 [Planctomycetota bacterium]|jgi:hypothetical protein
MRLGAATIARQALDARYTTDRRVEDHDPALGALDTRPRRELVTLGAWSHLGAGSGNLLHGPNPRTHGPLGDSIELLQAEPVSKDPRVHTKLLGQIPAEVEGIASNSQQAPAEVPPMKPP